MTWRTEIRTPGLPPNTRRLGDLRLECHVGMEAGLVSNTLPIIGMLANLIQGMPMLVPRSHKHGTLQAGHDLTTTSYPLWTLDQDTVTRLCREAERDGKPGIVAPTGKPGSVLMFHGNLVHASAPNITPYPRKIVYLTLCAVSNHITKFTGRSSSRIATSRRSSRLATTR